MTRGAKSVLQLWAWLAACVGCFAGYVWLVVWGIHRWGVIATWMAVGASIAGPILLGFVRASVRIYHRDNNL